jgi:hypothetical protein
MIARRRLRCIDPGYRPRRIARASVEERFPKKLVIPSRPRTRPQPGSTRCRDERSAQPIPCSTRGGRGRCGFIRSARDHPEAALSDMSRALGLWLTNLNGVKRMSRKKERAEVPAALGANSLRDSSQVARRRVRAGPTPQSAPTAPVLLSGVTVGRRRRESARFGRIPVANPVPKSGRGKGVGLHSGTTSLS